MFARPLLFFFFREDEVWSGFLLAGLLLSQVVIIVAVVVVFVFGEDCICVSCWAWDWSDRDGVPKWWGHREVCSSAVGGTLEDGLTPRKFRDSEATKESADRTELTGLCWLVLPRPKKRFRAHTWPPLASSRQTNSSHSK